MTEPNFFAPVDGVVMPLANVPDPVFAQKMLGDGVAIEPTSSLLLAPSDGKVTQLHPSHHAVTILTPSGLQILLHIGIDTVKLKGKGFSPLIQLGDSVRKGQGLIRFDSDFVAQKAKSLLTVMVVCEGPAHALKDLRAGQTVRAGIDKVFAARMMGATTEAPTVQSASAQESKILTMNLPNGLHARPAARLTALAKGFAQTTLSLRKNGRTANAKSVVDLLGLELLHADKFQIVAVGGDCARALAAVVEFLLNLEETAEPHLAKSISPAGGGIGISPGLALGRVWHMGKAQFEIARKADLTKVLELELLQAALNQARDEIAQLRRASGGLQSEIFAAHEEMLQDPAILDPVVARIERGESAAFAWHETVTELAHKLQKLNNELLRNRAADLHDVDQRVLKAMGIESSQAKPTVAGPMILIAENLTPSEAAQFGTLNIAGFCTVEGGATSHVAILARSMGIPAIAGIDRTVLALPVGAEIIIDGESGLIQTSPTPAQKRQVEEWQTNQKKQKTANLKHAFEIAQTIDGRAIHVHANIGNLADLETALKMGADGVGLLRTEFMFLEREQAPSEEEQLGLLQQMASFLGERTFTIRTLDVGGDKPLSYLPLPREENPFLGVRGLRIGLRQPEILRQQLRAILRIKSRATINVMFPMVASLEEFVAAKAIVEEERRKLKVEPVAVGIMVEVPSAALTAQVFAPAVDFFSIGTNDLTQYTLAMDRGHKELARSADGLHPSVLSLIEMTTRAAQLHGKWVGVCGGLAGDTEATELLLGFGIDELSVSPPCAPLINARVRGLTLARAQVLARQALKMDSAVSVRKMCEKKPTSERGAAHGDTEDVLFVPSKNR